MSKPGFILGDLVTLNASATPVEDHTPHWAAPWLGIVLRAAESYGQEGYVVRWLSSYHVSAGGPPHEEWENPIDLVLISSKNLLDKQ
tara:strand:- start:153 stop:413 length:261 start_codon:yes stop_codon:yes gene_type:complete